MVKFLNLVPWGGLYFCRKPNEVIDLPEETAIAREKLGLGRRVIDKSKPAAPPVQAVEPKPAPKPEAPKAPAVKNDTDDTDVSKLIAAQKAANPAPKPDPKTETKLEAPKA